jgi:hypothetical protein
MVVRKLPSTEFQTALVPAAVREAKPNHVEDMREEFDSFHQRINSGRAFLKVVAYPWGVEFDVCDEAEEK